MMTAKQIEQRRQAGRQGGLRGGAVTFERYGREHMSKIGKLGGGRTFEQWLERARKRERAHQARSRPGRKGKE